MANMLASLLRSRKPRIRADRSPFSSPYTTQENTTFFRRDKYTHRLDSDIEDSEEIDDGFDNIEEEDDEDYEQEDLTPLLPIFSAAHLGSYPIETRTHYRHNDHGSWILTNHFRRSSRV
jgi:hypothetical protein